MKKKILLAEWVVTNSSPKLVIHLSIWNNGEKTYQIDVHKLSSNLDDSLSCIYKWGIYDIVCLVLFFLRISIK